MPPARPRRWVMGASRLALHTRSLINTLHDEPNVEPFIEMDQSLHNGVLSWLSRKVPKASEWSKRQAESQLRDPIAYENHIRSLTRCETGHKHTVQHPTTRAIQSHVGLAERRGYRRVFGPPGANEALAILPSTGLFLGLPRSQGTWKLGIGC